MHKQVTRLQIALFVVMVMAASAAAADEAEKGDYVAAPLVVLNDNGAWSWFMDPRAIIDHGKLLVGSVRAVGDFRSGRDDPRWGNVELAVHDLASGNTQVVVLDPHFEQDDHDAPALLALPDGRYLAVHTRHAVERKVFYQLSEPGDPLHWSSPQTFVSPGKRSPAFSGDNVTYSNLFLLPSGRVINFYRGFAYDPNYMFSDDSGRTWKYGGRVLRGRDGYGPYTKYADDGHGTIHFLATEDHPRNFDNSLYHAMLRDGEICLSDGTPLGKLSDSTDTPITAWDLTKVFPGDPDDVAWMTDLKVDAEGKPYAAFSVQKDGRGLPRGQGGFDHRFYYARWDGKTWQVHEIAYAGTRLYAGEDDYTGLVALDPRDPNTLYISTDADPKTGEPLGSSADGRRHRELFRGITGDGGATWTWQPITANSTVDNLRPIVPRWDDPRTVLVWMRGTYRHNHGQWTTAPVAVVLPPADDRP